MPLPFDASLTALRGPKPRAAAVRVGVSACLVAAWLAWATFARVTVQASSVQARVESAEGVRWAESEVEGVLLDRQLLGVLELHRARLRVARIRTAIRGTLGEPGYL